MLTEMANKRNIAFPYQTIAVVPAAGFGVRMGEKKAKQFLELCGKPILAVTLDHLQRCDLIDRIVVVAPEVDINYCRREIVEKYNLSKVLRVVSGGRRRQDSVRRGIETVADSCKWVLIHDGVRPLVTDDLIRRVVEAAKDFRAVIPGLPIAETVKEIDDHGIVLRSIDRSRLWSIQTPQIFRWDDISLAHKEAITQSWEDATDDSFLIEKIGIPVNIIKGEKHNMKITTPQDLDMARSLMQDSFFNHV